MLETVELVTDTEPPEGMINGFATSLEPTLPERVTLKDVVPSVKVTPGVFIVVVVVVVLVAVAFASSSTNACPPG